MKSKTLEAVTGLSLFMCGVLTKFSTASLTFPRQGRIAIDGVSIGLRLFPKAVRNNLCFFDRNESRGACLSSKWRDEGVRLAKKLGTPSFRSSRGYVILG
ncbi:hypothetical protein AVEN_267867-1 [Araneus ventricosus]|uniref:Uncharacterized protein n=1 Tax=Araneus ventricosus TaxID=182803 RepID=A0A4Y2PHG4_ARAVE|nr:hypothetical protein AVEN_267867-1 [Araneus ventricosus]